MTRQEMDKAIKLSKEFATLYGDGIVDMTPVLNDRAEMIPRIQMRFVEFLEMYGDSEFQYKDRIDGSMKVEIMDDGVIVFALVDRYEYPKRSKA